MYVSCTRVFLLVLNVQPVLFLLPSYYVRESVYLQYQIISVYCPFTEGYTNVPCLQLATYSNIVPTGMFCKHHTVIIGLHFLNADVVGFEPMDVRYHDKILSYWRVKPQASWP